MLPVTVETVGVWCRKPFGTPRHLGARSGPVVGVFEEFTTGGQHFKVLRKLLACPTAALIW